jgi:uncharacterized protein YycO
VNAQPGDLLLFRVSKSSNWLDKLIGWGQRVIHQAPGDATYCHVAIFGPDAGSIFEAVWPRIHNVPLDVTKVQKNLILEVYRVKDITPAQVALVLAAAKKRVGARYDVLAILTFGILQFGRATVCSQYAYQCFLDAGIVLGQWEDLESPDDIAASGKLTRVT